MKLNHRYSCIILIIIPLILFINSLLLNYAMGPFWQYADPCYLYLFNAIHFLKGIAPTHIDHPGTPVQLLILFIIFIINLGSSVTVIVEKVLRNPEYYLHAVNYILITGIALSSYLLAKYVYNKTQDLLAALLTQLPGLTFLITKSFTSTLPVPPVVANVNPEPLLIIILNLFNLSWFSLFFAKDSKERLLATLMLGFICGLGLATKLTFFPILICALIILSWPLKLIFMGMSLISFCLWTLPIMHQYPILWAWAKGIVTHTGMVGDGSQGFIDFPKYLYTLVHIFLPEYGLFNIFAIASFIVSSIKIIEKKQNPVYKFLWVINIGILFQFAMVAKHYSSHYLLPGLGLFSCALPLFYLGFLSENKILKQFTLIFIIIFTIITSSQTFIYYPKLSTLTQEISNAREGIYNKYPGAAIIAPADSNPFFNQKFALLFADRFYSRLLYNKSYTHQESDELSVLYPDSYYLNFDGTSASHDNLGYGICDFKERVFADDLLEKYPDVIFINYKFDFYAHNGFDLSEHPLTAILVNDSKYADIYRITASTDKESTELLNAAMMLSEKGQYKEAFALALKSRELNYQPKDQADFILSIIYNHLRQP